MIFYHFEYAVSKEGMQTATQRDPMYSYLSFMVFHSKQLFECLFMLCKRVSKY